MTFSRCSLYHFWRLFFDWIHLPLKWEMRRICWFTDRQLYTCSFSLASPCVPVLTMPKIGYTYRILAFFFFSGCLCQWDPTMRFALLSSFYSKSYSAPKALILARESKQASPFRIQLYFGIFWSLVSDWNQPNITHIQTRSALLTGRIYYSIKSISKKNDQKFHMGTESIQSQLYPFLHLQKINT